MYVICLCVCVLVCLKESENGIESMTTAVTHSSGSDWNQYFIPKQNKRNRKNKNIPQKTRETSFEMSEPSLQTAVSQSGIELSVIDEYSNHFKYDSSEECLWCIRCFNKIHPYLGKWLCKKTGIYQRG